MYMDCPVVSGGLIYMYYHRYKVIRSGDMVMVFNATFSNILYRGGQFYWRRKPEYPEKINDLSASYLPC